MFVLVRTADGVVVQDETCTGDESIMLCTEGMPWLEVWQEALNERKG